MTTKPHHGQKPSVRVNAKVARKINIYKMHQSGDVGFQFVWSEEYSTAVVTVKPQTARALARWLLNNIPEDA